MQEWFGDRLAWADKNEAAVVRREFDTYMAEVSSKREDARPELDLLDAAACHRAAWRAVSAQVRACAAYVEGGEPVAVEWDGDVLLEQMQRSIAAGW